MTTHAIELREAGTADAWTPMAAMDEVVASNASTLSLAGGLSAATSYEVRIAAVSAWGQAATYAVVNATGGSANVSTSEDLRPVLVPGATLVIGGCLAEVRAVPPSRCWQVGCAHCASVNATRSTGGGLESCDVFYRPSHCPVQLYRWCRHGASGSRRASQRRRCRIHGPCICARSPRRTCHPHRDRRSHQVVHGATSRHGRRANHVV